jgi:NAD(P)H-nitrite reductase large subunit
MEIDAKVCYCFHVSKRKILSFIRHEKPKVASMLSECAGAGSGCGWCVPFLKQIHAQCLESGSANLEILHSDDYAKGREAYIKSGKGKPPSPPK